MKTLCSLLLFSLLLLVGCYTERSISRDDVVPDDHTVFFYLVDGSYIKSYSDRHHRSEEGGSYEVTGTLVRRNHANCTFEGAIPDSAIARAAVERLSWPGTAFMAVGASLGIATIVWAASGGSLPH